MTSIVRDDRQSGLLANLTRDSSVVAVLAGEFEQLMKQIYEPELLVNGAYHHEGLMTVWGAINTDTDHFRCQVYHSAEFPHNWAFLKRYNKETLMPILVEARVDGRGIAMHDDIRRAEVLHAIENPQLIEYALSQLLCNIDHRLFQVELRMEYCVNKGITQDGLCLDGSDSLAGRLHVLKENRRLFHKRYRAVQL